MLKSVRVKIKMNREVVSLFGVVAQLIRRAAIRFFFPSKLSLALFSAR